MIMTALEIAITILQIAAVGWGVLVLARSFQQVVEEERRFRG